MCRKHLLFCARRNIALGFVVEAPATQRGDLQVFETIRESKAVYEK